MISIQAKIILKILQIIKAAYDYFLDEDTKQYLTILVLVVFMLVIFLPSMFIGYVRKHPIHFLETTLSLVGSSFVEAIKDVFVDDTQITIDPSNIAPMGETEFNYLLTEAKRHVGKPYVWGKDNPNIGFDCSGYVCYVFSNSGVKSMPRTDAQGIFDYYVDEIPQDEARAGDIVFFERTYETKNKITHVGIYLGNNYIIHAGDPIGYANINTGYWQSHIYAFGRIR